jgi:hypothetical protein
MDKLNMTTTQERLAEAERLIEITKQTREDAIKKKTESQTKLEMSKEELLKLGITPENAEAELEKLQNEILAELAEVENNIPKDLLASLKRI